MAGAALLPSGAAAQTAGRAVKTGRLKQSVCRWCYGKIPMPDFCTAVAGLGLTAIDLVDEKDWPLLAEHGLICSMGWQTSSGGIPDGLNDPKNHDAIVNAANESLLGGDGVESSRCRARSTARSRSRCRDGSRRNGGCR